MLNRRTVWLTIALLVVTTPALAAWQAENTSPQQSQILNKVEQLVETTKQPVVIIDLDSTLYKNFGRWAVILQEYGKVKGIKELQAMTAERITDSFNFDGVMVNDAGVSAAQAKELMPDFKKFWTERFFNNNYVKYDVALPGAVAYVQGLYKKGAFIVYLTGRDDTNMRAGTEAKLKADGFPIGMERTTLMMKPTSNVKIGKDDKKLSSTDKDWKQAALAKVETLGTVVASFDNEPGHINVYYDAFHTGGRGVAVWLDTDHFPKNEPTPLRPGIVTIRGFLR